MLLTTSESKFDFVKKTDTTLNCLLSKFRSFYRSLYTNHVFTQALQNLSTLQTHQRSLIASAESSAAQLASLQIERDEQHRTSQQQATAALQAGTVTLAETQAAATQATQAREVGKAYYIPGF